MANPENRETTTVKRWISNDAGYYSLVDEQARAFLDNKGKEDAIFALADYLKDFFGEEVYEQMANLGGVYQELLTHSLGVVDWDDIATDIIESIVYEDTRKNK